MKEFDAEFIEIHCWPADNRADLEILRFKLNPDSPEIAVNEAIDRARALSAGSAKDYRQITVLTESRLRLAEFLPLWMLRSTS